jgi:4-hydroxybenzoate polyprenyltransferase
MTVDAVMKAPAFPVALFRALRPRQWVKNGVLLAGIVFTLDHGHPLGNWLRVAAAVLVFCALASAVYLVNDLCDVEQDRKHPRKRLRPLAAGHLSPSTATAAAAVLALAGMAGAAALGPLFLLTAGGYLALTVAYSFWLKHEVLLDVIALAFCYVIRAAAGAVVIAVEISPWLFGVTFLGALVLGLAKRRHELLTLEEAGSHRRILDEYSVQMLDGMLNFVAAGTLVAYMLYTISSPTAQQRPLLMLTIPFVVYGMLRFFYLIHRHGKGGDPSTEFIDDRPLLLCGLLWAFVSALIMVAGR